MPGVHAVLTHDDVPGRKTYGMEIADQPVLAWKTIRYQGEAVAIVAADDPETARRAVKAIKVEYDVLPPLTDAEEAMKPDAPQLHLSGNTLRHLRINHGNPDATAPVVVTGTYEVGMQDQAFLGPESGLAIPDEEGGVDLHIATQWLHVDRDQVAESLGLPHDKVRLSMGGVGGAFGGREDLLDAGPRVHARAPHRPAGEDRLQPRRVLLRPRAPAPGEDVLRARGRPRRQPDLRPRRRSSSTAAPTRRPRRRWRRTPPASPPARTRCRTRASTRT